jgi:hypothetical protein
LSSNKTFIGFSSGFYHFLNHRIKSANIISMIFITASGPTEPERQVDSLIGDHKIDRVDTSRQTVRARIGSLEKSTSINFLIAGST